MSVDPNVDARIKEFMAGVQKLMEQYEMEIAVIGLSTRATEEGFTTFAAAIRDRNQPVAEALTQLDAIRTDITGVYDEIGKSITQQLMSGEGMRERMDAAFGRGQGHDYTYLYPGIRKVVQAAGRVMRALSSGTV